MPAFFDLMRDEPEASVRVVLGHFFFVNIHPYPDGNGRMGRFLMNALEAASVQGNIRPFAELVAGLVSKQPSRHGANASVRIG